MHSFKSFILSFILFAYSLSSYALVPMENLILGDLSEYYAKEKQDPLDSIFLNIDQRASGVEQSELEKSKIDLAFYRALLEEGSNLNNYCSRSEEVEYATSFDKDQALRSVFAHLQYRGLDYTVRAIARYAEYFNFSSDEYNNLVETMVNGSCSKNISVISLKQLKKNMMARFQENDSFELPSIQGNPLFSQELTEFFPSDDVKEREMLTTLQLFQAFCSWGGLSDRPRLLTPLLKNPVIMSFLALDMGGKALEWDLPSSSVRKRERQDTSAVSCQNLICRRVDRGEFNKLMPRMIGSVGLEDDLRRLYCREFKDAKIVIHEDEPSQIVEMKKNIENKAPLLPLQFFALISKVPDFIIGAKSFDEGQFVAETSLNQTWNDWATKQTESFTRDLYYEEALTFELVDRDLYFRPKEKNFKVVIDVNLGEYDRVNQMLGKLSASFHLKISKPLLRWAQLQWNKDVRDIVAQRESIQKRLLVTIEDQVEQARSKFAVPPWSKGLEKLIVSELLEQLSSIDSEVFQSTEKGLTNVPVELYFGPFALKYQNYRYKVERNKKLAKERELNRELRRKQERIRNEREGSDSSANFADEMAKAPKN